MVNSRTNAFSSPPDYQTQARLLIAHLENAPHSPLAQFLLRLRQLPLGRPGILALARLSSRELKFSETLRLIPANGNRKRAVILPNVFLDLNKKCVDEFLRAASDPRYLRNAMKKFMFAVNEEFSLSMLGRLFESIVGDFYSSVLIRIYNFRGAPGRWPDKMLPNGGNWIAKSAPPPKSSHRIRLERRLSFIRRVCRDYRNWAYRPDQQQFNFSLPTGDLPETERQNYQIILEIVRYRNTTHSPRSNTALAIYLLLAVDIFEWESGKRKSLKNTPAMREARRRVEKARIALASPSQNEIQLSGSGERDLTLNLVPIRFLEEMIYSRLAPIEDTKMATCCVILLIELFTGRRISDYADVTLAHFVTHLSMMDLTIPITKIRSIRGIKLPQHRLLPAKALSYVQTWRESVSEKATTNPNITLYELVTGLPRKPGTPKGNAVTALDKAVVSVLDNELSRLHVFRYAFATWGCVAAVLAWDPVLLTHPQISPWVKDSLFFEEAQLAQWRDLTGSRTADPFAVVSLILGHSSTLELQRDYFVGWQLLTEIAIANIQVAK